MIIDTSAIVAIVRDEPDQQVFMARLMRAHATNEPMRMSAATLVELMIVIDRFKDQRSSQILDLVLDELQLDIVPVDTALPALARSANRRFGKGNHPARLNFGDCFAYALASQLDEPLLYKGTDFARTDIRSAL